MHKGLLRLVASNELASGNLRLASCLGESQSPGMKVSFLETVIATELSDWQAALLLPLDPLPPLIPHRLYNTPSHRHDSFTRVGNSKPTPQANRDVKNA
jgi:hypothetical protein